MTDLEARMRQFVKNRGLSLDVCLAPDPNNKRHAEIVDRTIIIYTEDPIQAWHSLIHEVTEWRFKPAFKIFRDAFNYMLSLVEQEANARKESAIEKTIQDHQEMWKELGLSLAPTKSEE